MRPTLNSTAFEEGCDDMAARTETELARQQDLVEVQLRTSVIYHQFDNLKFFYKLAVRYLQRLQVY